MRCTNETDHTTPVDFNPPVATANIKLLQRVGHLDQSVGVGDSLVFQIHRFMSVPIDGSSDARVVSIGPSWPGYAVQRQE